ncbi:MAG: class I SAM-dependent methyltransferase [Bacteroidota bacterium]
MVPMNKEMMAQCPLCEGRLNTFTVFKGETFLQCESCFSVVRDPQHWLDPEEENKRYGLHENDVYDKHYRNFVAPIVEAVYAYHEPQEEGLDYGAGPGPVVATMLTEKGYSLHTYDPFFHPKPELLTQTYNYIVCCEVMEHFHTPALEFTRLRELLAPGGSLLCMTSLFHEGLDFNGWGYKNDDTHVFFYHARAIEWIRANFGFKRVTINERFLHFVAPEEDES